MSPRATRRRLTGWGLILVSPALLAAIPYAAIHENWTKELTLYHEFGIALSLTGTYESDDFRRALIDERIAQLGLSKAGNDVFEARLRAEGRQFHEVVLSAENGLPSVVSFGTDPERGWALQLTADGKDEPFVFALRIKSPNSLQRHLYPQTSVWRELWIARFERSVAKPREVVLQVSSGYGTGQLRWEAD